MTLADFKNLHAGATAYIVGKGPSLDTLDVSFIYSDWKNNISWKDRITIALNQATKKFDRWPGDHCPISNRYCVQHDCNSKMADSCVPSLSKHFMNCWQEEVPRVTGKLVKVTESFWNPRAVLYDPTSFEQESVYSATDALNIAKFMGCKKVVFCCFDSWKDGGSTAYADSLSQYEFEDITSRDRHKMMKHEILACCNRLELEWSTLS